MPLLKIFGVYCYFIWTSYVLLYDSVISNLKILTFYVLGTSMFRFEDLRLEGNELQYLTENDFRFVYKIKELYIQKNQIIRIDTHTFRKVRTSLESLDLSSNDITFINGSIRHMWELYYLNLAFNSIKVSNILSNLFSWKWLFYSHGILM